MNESVTIQLDLPADARYLGVLGACLHEMLSQRDALAEQTRYNLALAAHEICANMIEHAYGAPAGRLALTLTLREAAFEFEARDHGARVFDPTQVPLPDATAFEQRGRGLWLVQQLTDQVTYAARDGRTFHFQHGWRADPPAAPRAHNAWFFRKEF